MKRLRHLALGLMLILSLSTSALAAEVPENLIVENLNGQQRMVKTYVVSPDTDPDTLQEQPFDYDGYHYTWAYTTKEELPYPAALHEHLGVKQRAGILALAGGAAHPGIQIRTHGPVRGRSLGYL